MTDIYKAAQQALDALEPYADIKPRDWKTDREKLWRSYDALRAALAEQPAEQEPCGWQFFQDGQWYNGSDRHDHRKHTEAAGFPTRDVYPAPQPAQTP